MPTARCFSAIRRRVNVPVAGLTSKRYAATLRAEHRRTRNAVGATSSAGNPKIARRRQHHAFFGDRPRRQRGANTYTLNFSYGLGLVADGTGVLLNNELDDFTAKPGAANAFGLVGYDSQPARPGKRPLSSMSPTIVLKDGKPVLVTGSPGGSRIITAVLQSVVNAHRFQDAGRRTRSARRGCIISGSRMRCAAEPGFAAETLRRPCRARPQRRAEPAGHLGQFDRGDAATAWSARPTRARAARWRWDIEIVPSKLERAKGFEPSTPTLARSCSTPELHPHPRRSCSQTGRRQ